MSPGRSVLRQGHQESPEGCGSGDSSCSIPSRDLTFLERGHLYSEPHTNIFKQERGLSHILGTPAGVPRSGIGPEGQEVGLGFGIPPPLTC